MKHNVGETVFLKGTICKITIFRNETYYDVAIDTGLQEWCDTIVEVKEENMDNLDSVTVDDYEREINDLKEDVQQWKDMYQGEHLKVEKLKVQLDLLKIAEELKGQEETICGEIDCERIKPSDFSHNPEKNTYAKKMHNFDDWRMP